MKHLTLPLQVCLVVEGVGAEDYLEHRDKELAWLQTTMPPLLEVPALRSHLDQSSPKY